MTVATAKPKRRKRPLILSEIKFMFPDVIPFVLKTKGYKFTDQELYAIDAANADLRIESNANGDLEIMPPTFIEMSRRNMEIIGQLGIWAKKDKTGVCFESSAKLPCRMVRNGCLMRLGF